MRFRRRPGAGRMGPVRPSRAAATTALAALAVGHPARRLQLGVVQNIPDLENAPNYWIDAIDGGVILVALILARVIGGEASAE